MQAVCKESKHGRNGDFAATVIVECDFVGGYDSWFTWCQHSSPLPAEELGQVHIFQQIHCEVFSSDDAGQLCSQG